MLLDAGSRLNLYHCRDRFRFSMATVGDQCSPSIRALVLDVHWNPDRGFRTGDREAETAGGRNALQRCGADPSLATRDARVNRAERDPEPPGQLPVTQSFHQV